MIRCSSAVKRGSLALRWVEGLGAEYELRDERPLCAYADSVGSSAANVAAVASAIAAARNTISASKQSLSEPPYTSRDVISTAVVSSAEALAGCAAIFPAPA